MESSKDAQNEMQGTGILDVCAEKKARKLRVYIPQTVFQVSTLANKTQCLVLQSTYTHVRRKTC